MRQRHGRAVGCGGLGHCPGWGPLFSTNSLSSVVVVGPEPPCLASLG